MKREWEPGDVAIVDGVGKRLPITFFENEDRGELMFNNGCGYQHHVRHLASTARPLVVIDPEDREQVDRLLDAVDKWGRSSADAISDLQAALREFANPTPPKPEEPTGLGAVVEDEKGLRWLRWWAPDGGQHPSQDRPWQCSNGGGGDRDYADISAVRVLSEGVAP